MTLPLVGPLLDNKILILIVKYYLYWNIHIIHISNFMVSTNGFKLKRDAIELNPLNNNFSLNFCLFANYSHTIILK
jgi:hypothetical protein